jgi:hypothetical protein
MNLNCYVLITDHGSLLTDVLFLTDVLVDNPFGFELLSPLSSLDRNKNSYAPQGVLTSPDFHLLQTNIYTIYKCTVQRRA